MTENLAQKIREEREPEGEIFVLSGEARRLRRALAVANKWLDAAFEDGGSGDLVRVAETTRDEIEEEVARTTLQMDVLRRRHEIGEAGRVFSSDEDLEGLSRAAVVSDALLAVYCVLRERYAHMGALLVALDAANAEVDSYKPA